MHEVPAEEPGFALKKLLSTSMPFGKYAGRSIMDLPEDYLLWFSKKGFPEGELGGLLALALEIRINGLEGMLGRGGS
jgi:uncharacterized protein (DUF3820 family)